MTSTRYLDIADQLAGELASCAPGTRVCSEPEVASRFGVGRAAARSALQELERRLVVRRIQGAGTFVNRRIDYLISRTRPASWHATVAAAGAVPRSQTKNVERTAVPAEDAARLGCPAGTPVYRVTRHFFIDDLLASVTQELIPLEAAPDLDIALHSYESVDMVLRQLGGVEPVRAWCRASLDIPPSEVLRELGIEASVPVWRIDSLSRDAASGEVLLTSSAWTRADAVRVVVELEDNSATGQNHVKEDGAK
ncbi:GntR family transcriptional regulator [Mycobacterium sp. 3519A]|jgi:GntR family phosphonate transport system transcriptional regulator|uniref:GntR family transcriptional regulator n=1 Tax=Mycobacterium sp. 3519A TaxID=2057184 RepID=UPI000C7E1080|nr:GntR family transcriptional regulator [Mycobacterium sp. 3519A]